MSHQDLLDDLRACCMCVSDTEEDGGPCTPCRAASALRAEVEAHAETKRDRDEVSAQARCDTGELWSDECERARVERDTARADLEKARADLEQASELALEAINHGHALYVERDDLTDALRIAVADRDAARSDFEKRGGLLCAVTNRVVDLNAELSEARSRIAELEDTILLREADDDIARSYGRNVDAGRIAQEIRCRRGEDWTGAHVEPPTPPEPKEVSTTP